MSNTSAKRVVEAPLTDDVMLVIEEHSKDQFELGLIPKNSEGLHDELWETDNMSDDDLRELYNSLVSAANLIDIFLAYRGK